jgi:hypothetical protein
VPPEPGQLVDCGPAPERIEGNMLEADKNDTDCASTKKSFSRRRSILPRSPVALVRRYLVDLQVTQENSPCLTCPRSNCRTSRVYADNQTITTQCYTRAQYDNGTINNNLDKEYVRMKTYT